MAAAQKSKVKINIDINLVKSIEHVYTSITPLLHRADKKREKNSRGIDLMPNISGQLRYEQIKHIAAMAYGHQLWGHHYSVISQEIGFGMQERMLN